MAFELGAASAQSQSSRSRLRPRQARRGTHYNVRGLRISRQDGCETWL